MEDNMKKITLIAFLFGLLSISSAFAHCQVPCGIFTDDLRFSMMNENADTVMKCMKQIVELSKAEKPDYNQIVRWITTKDHHADDIIDICSKYFLCQQVKAPKDLNNENERQAYLKKLELVHKLMVTAMKCKQTTDITMVENLKNSIHEFQHAYSGAHTHKH